jgi:hypothetical protein
LKYLSIQNSLLVKPFINDYFAHKEDSMKKLFISLLLICFSTSSLFALDQETIQITQKLIYNDLIKYSDDYGIDEIFEIDFLGSTPKQYSFYVVYSKKFCSITQDDERMSCAIYKCGTQADLDRDAVVNFESESKKSACEKIEDTDTSELY